MMICDDAGWFYNFDGWFRRGMLRYSGCLRWCRGFRLSWCNARAARYNTLFWYCFFFVLFLFFGRWCLQLVRFTWKCRLFFGACVRASVRFFPMVLVFLVLFFGWPVSHLPRYKASVPKSASTPNVSAAGWSSAFHSGEFLFGLCTCGLWLFFFFG